MISPDTIERIRDRASIVELIGESVKLERRGRSLLGLCPFHKEKSPSFHVNEERGRYHCFGCQASGDVFKFIQETEGLNFIEAIKRLGERYGVPVADDMSDEDRRVQAAAKRREQALFDVNLTAAAYFERMLVDSPDGRLALDELERRGLPYGGPAQDVLKAFKIGYAPNGWDGLANHLRQAGLDARAAEDVGLLAPRKQGPGHYDRFRHRLMFAVLDLQGRVVAFSGRALPSKEADGDPPAKYINSPESPIYKKRQTVFGLYQARAKLRDGETCVVVEGNFDVVSLHARGIGGAVAPLGTAFTVEQGRSIRRFTGDVVFLFDGDRAGREATQKSRGPAREAGLLAKVARLPDGVDPDDFSRERGQDALKALIGAARGMLDHLIAEALDDQFAASDAHARAQKVQQVLELLSTEEDPTVRALAEQHADLLAARLGVADARTFRALRQSVERSLSAPARSDETRTDGRPIRAPARALSRRQDADIVTSAIGALLDFPELLNCELLEIYADTLQGDLAATVACMRRESRRGSAEGNSTTANLHGALAKLPITVRPFVEARLAAPLHLSVDEAEAELLANLKKLESVQLSELGVTAVNELERARLSGDFDLELDLLRQQEQRARQRRGMK